MSNWCTIKVTVYPFPPNLSFKKLGTSLLSFVTTSEKHFAPHSLFFARYSYVKNA